MEKYHGLNLRGLPPHLSPLLQREKPPNASQNQRASVAFGNWFEDLLTRWESVPAVTEASYR
jgi:hypothetical protein